MGSLLEYSYTRHFEIILRAILEKFENIVVENLKKMQPMQIFSFSIYVLYGCIFVLIYIWPFFTLRCFVFAFSIFISNLLCSWIALHLPFPLHLYIWQFLLIRKFVCVLDLCLNVCICIWIVLSICFRFAQFLNCALSALPPLRLPGILIDSKPPLTLRLQNSG